MSWAGGVMAIGVVWLLGALTLSVARLRPEGGAHALVSELVTGVVILSVTGMTAIALGLRPSLGVTYVLIGILATVGLRARRLPPPPRIRLPDDVAAKGLVAAASAVVVALGLASVRDRLWWDGWAIWAFKARVLFMDGTLTRAFLEGDGGYGFTHPDYPLAVPLMDWWIWRHAQSASAALASFMGAIWFALLTLLLWSSLRRVAGERTAALGALGMALFWPVALYATGGTADVVIAISLLGAISELHHAIGSRDVAPIVRCGIFLTLGAVAKNEGLAIAVVVAVVGAGVMFQHGALSVGRLAPLALPFLGLAPWWIFASSLNTREGAVVSSTLPLLPERLPLFAQRLSVLGGSVPWLPLSLIAALGLLAAARRSDRGLVAGWLALGGYFSVICAVYLFTPQDMAWLLATSLPRVLGPFVAPLIFLSVAGTGHRPARALISP